MSAAELWRELSVNLRMARVTAGLSLRQVEQRTGWGRGTLSQIENAKARPTRLQVEWYDDQLGGDGLLISTFAEARGAHGPASSGPARSAPLDGDAFAIASAVVAQGEVVAPDTELAIGWTIRNTGSVPWRDRRLRRVGASRALRMIASDTAVPLPDCLPREQVEVRFPVRTPDQQALLAAYWEITDDQGNRCFGPPSLIPLVLLVRAAESG